MEIISNISHIYQLLLIIGLLCYSRQDSSNQILWRTYVVAEEVQLATPKVSVPALCCIFYQ